MEKLSELSKLSIAPITAVHDIPVTEVGCRDRHRARIEPLTSTTAKTTISFCVPPTLPHELHLRSVSCVMQCACARVSECTSVQVGETARERVREWASEEVSERTIESNLLI